MPKFPLHPAAVPASEPADVRLQIVSHCAKPPDGDNLLHEIKHDGHRLVAIVTGRESLKLLSRNGIDRTRLFRDPFKRPITTGGFPALGLSQLLSDAPGRGGTTILERHIRG
jgi:hypothetical protein